MSMFCGLDFFPIAKISKLMVDNLAKLKQNSGNLFQGAVRLWIKWIKQQ